MSGMTIKLAAGERFYLNGVLILNGKNRTTLIFSTRGNFLREKECVSETDANTSPAHRVYFLWQEVVAGIVTDAKEIELRLGRVSEIITVRDPENSYDILKQLQQSLPVR